MDAGTRPNSTKSETCTDAPKCTAAVVKVASRCNLNCTYCYVYNVGDETYRSQPALMSGSTATNLIRRVAEHCIDHRIAAFTFAFHGGEPLLARPEFFRSFVEEARATLPSSTRASFALQTNGTRLTAAWCALFKDLGIKIGISLDGPPSVNDKHRVDHSGRGSYASVLRGWTEAQESGLVPGLLIVVAPWTDPLQAFEHLSALDPRSVDFLLPDATHDRPPSALGPTGAAHFETPFAGWLIGVFDLWVAHGRDFGIRLFDQIIAAVLGQRTSSDAMGTGFNEVLVIETDGSIEPADVLKVCREGITKTDLTVHANRLDDAYGHDLVSLYHTSNERVCETCMRCPVGQICAGGYLPHRYSEKNGFDNPSVYCADLLRLITHIQNWVVGMLPADVIATTGLKPLPRLPGAIGRCE